MGNASSHTYAGPAPPPAADARVILQHDLPKAIYMKKLANGKFIKSYQCRVDGVMVVVKAYIKRDPQEDLGPVDECLSKMAKALDTRSCPNVLPYQRWLQSNVRASQHRGAGTPAYLLRQHLLGTLSDRLSTRPFLTDTEKRWLVYLLLRAAAQCHAKGVCHGDIKSENVLVTSGNWLLLTDFAPFKPTFLPDDHPADANYYFSSGEQGRCYLAPERFHSAPQTNEDSGSAGVGGASAATVTTGARGSDGGVSDVAGGVSTGARPGPRRGGGLEGLEASEIRPSPGLDLEASTPASGTSSPPMGLDAQTTPPRQQQQQQSKQGGGRDDGSRSGRGGPATVAAAERQVLTPGEGLLESMDVFSLGCVIAEIFLGGDPLLDLPGLLRYRISGDMDSRLKKLETAGGPVVLRLVEHMVQRDASQRKTVQEYIRRMEKPGMLFPRSFGSFLFPLLAAMHAGQGAGDMNDGEEESGAVVGGQPRSVGEATAKPVGDGGGADRGAVRSPDGRLELVVRSYGRAMRELAGTPDPEGHALLQAALLGGRGDRRRQPASAGNRQCTREKQQGVGDAGSEVDEQQRRRAAGRGEGMETDRKSEGGDLTALMERTRTLIARVEALDVGTRRPSNETTRSSKATATTPGRSGDAAEIASSASDGPEAVGSGSQQGRAVGGVGVSNVGGDRGSLIILVQVVCSCLRHLRYPRSRLLALNLLVAFGRCCDDEARLQRLVPYTMTMLEDPVPVVRATAVRSLRALLGMVTSFPPSDSNIFLLYIFPALQRLPSDSSDLVRIAFAESLASLAETSRRFLETAYAMRRAAAASAAAASAIASASTTPGGSGGSGQGSSLTSANQQNAASAIPAPVADVENKNDYDGGENEDADGRRSEGGVVGAGSGGVPGGHGGSVNNKRNSTEIGAGAAGAVLLDGNYDKELSSIRGQISRWFVVLASSGGAGGGGGGGGGSSSGVSGDWSGIGLAAIAAAAAGADDGVGAGAAAVMVKRALLSDITRLCVFFGFENTLDSILPQLITFLNDRDWSLRAAFCEHIPAVCALAGEVATTRFILPCIENTLVDAREAVVARGLRCLAALAGLGLLPRHALPGQATPAAPLLQHPGIGIRASATELCLRAAAALGPVDAQVFLHPVLRPHLRYALSGSGPLEEAVLVEALRSPVSREVFDAAVAEVCEARRRLGRVNGGGGGDKFGDSEQQRAAASSSSAAVGASMIMQHDGQQSRQQSSDDDGMQRRCTVGADSTRGENQEPLLERRRASSGAEAVASSDRGVVGMGRRVSVTASSEEQEALALLKGCIDTTAQHVANKGRGASSGGGGKGSASLIGGRSSPVFLPESLSQAIYVPTQKITTLHPGVGVAKTTEAAAAAAAAAADGRRGGVSEFESVGEDNVDVRLHSPALSSSPSLVQAVTGMHVNAFDARRAMALVEQADADAWPDGYTPSGTYSSPVFIAGQQGRRGPVSPGWEKSVGGGRADEAAALLRRTKALGVPPLPPDLGAVRGPNGVKYSHYLLQPGNGSSSSTVSSGVASAPGSSSTSSAATAAAAAVQHHQQQQQQHQPSYEHGNRRPDWRPRQGVLVASLAEHGGSVNRLALSQDQAFFVSASSDGTCKVWELRGMEHTVSPQSRATYSRQGGKLLDLCVVDNSHSMASASSDGTVHVWRVELAASTGALPFNSSTSGASSVAGVASHQPGMGYSSPLQQHSAGISGAFYANGATPEGSGRRYKSVGIGHVGLNKDNAGLSSSSAGGGGLVGRGRSGGSTPPRVCGSSMVRCVSPEEGPLVSVHHFNTELGSPLVYGTRKGGVRSWDLRAREEPWALRAHPELGFLTAIALGTEKTWLVVGTSRGFVMLWDLRFQILARLWRHSSGGPVHKLATCSRLPPPDASPGPHVIVAAGRNEAAIWDLSRGGACKQCFRVIPPSERPPPSTRSRIQPSVVLPGPDLPVLEEVPLPNHPNAPALSLGAQLSAVRDFSSGAPHSGVDPAIRALVGRISRSERDSYLITGGTDRCIRYWDFQAASRCYMVSGREPFLGRPSSRTLQVPGMAQGSSASNVVVYFDDDAPAPTPTLVSKRGLLPVAEEKGLVAPRSSHEDAVLDVKVTELPIKMLLSAGRDGVVKIWR